MSEEWISVDLKLPEPLIMVLVVDWSCARTDEHEQKHGFGVKRAKGVRLGYLREGSRLLLPEGFNAERSFVTHWKPLPEPPGDNNER